jgi:hypothetical protein
MMPNLSNLRLHNVAFTHCSGEKRVGDDFEDASIVVHCIVIAPRPESSPTMQDASQIWMLALKQFETFVLDSEARDSDELQKWIQNALTIKLTNGELSYTEALMLLGHYIILTLILMWALGPPDPSLWKGLIQRKKNLYPFDDASRIWNKLKEQRRNDAIAEVLHKFCPNDEPMHPWLTTNSTKPFIDTMGAILNMVTVNKGASFHRELLIASRRNVFMGHVFVTYAAKPLNNVNNVKGLMPYGIQRSGFYLPGTCVSPDDASGFVQALFSAIDKIVTKNDVTHVFAWPLPKMKARFLEMGYTLLPKKQRIKLEYQELVFAVRSIYGQSNLSTRILSHEFNDFDFVLRIVKEK